MKKLLISTLFLSILINSSTSVTTFAANNEVNDSIVKQTSMDDASVEVTIPDINLKTALNKAISNTRSTDQTIYRSELSNLKFLRLGNKSIDNLEGIQYCTNLTELSLHKNQIADISSLKSLTKLVYLSLYKNQITDITPLKELSNLNTLYLNNNQITDITPLKELSNLNTLFLHDNQITDITPLKNLSNLKFLSLENQRNI